jgi:hypothetical protein
MINGALSVIEKPIWRHCAALGSTEQAGDPTLFIITRNFNPFENNEPQI